MEKIEFLHRPVLLQEALDGLNIKADGIYVDGTFGRGGHCGAILKRLGPKGRVIAIDKDPDAIKSGLAQFGQDPRFSIYQGSFTRLKAIVEGLNLKGSISGVLLDLGVSSPQLDDPLRGFSFLKEGPLNMRMDQDTSQSAAEFVNTASETQLREVFWDFGEERFARQIARAIVAARAEKAIETTGELAAIVKEAHPRWERDKHPATRVFQAIRIFINGELDELPQCLEQAVEVLEIGGRLAVISFHSLEDRIVKRFMRQASNEPLELKRLPIQVSQWIPRLRCEGRARVPSQAEIEQNPRARSAVLRVAEKMKVV